MNLRRLLNALTLSVSMGLVFVAVPASAQHAEAPGIAPGPDRERARMNQRVFDRVWTDVRREYYDPGLHGVDWNAARRTFRPQALTATDDRGLYRALNAMLDLLNDDHAGAAPPAVARRQDMLRQRRAMIGLSMRPDPAGSDHYTVERVVAGSAADEAGVAVGWRLEVQSGSQWTPEQEVVEGQPIALTLVDLTGTRRPVVLIPRVMDPQPAFVADRSRPGVVVLTVEGFEPGLGRWMGEQLAGLPVDTDVVMDLRGNSGGRLLEAEAVLSCFLPPDRVWATRRPRSGRSVVMSTGAGCGGLAGPASNDVAVLVDGQSRSAAELTPAALQEARRALVVGERTAGAVLISQEARLPDGGRLTLSRADFITSGGVRLEKNGVQPDLLAARTAEDRQAGRDPALEAAIAALALPRAEQALAPPAAPL